MALRLIRERPNDYTRVFAVERDVNNASAAILAIAAVSSLLCMMAACFTALPMTYKVCMAALLLGYTGSLLLEVKSESVKVMKDVGITLSSTRQCGITSSTFIDIEKVRAVIINEAVTTTNIRYYLAFVIYNSNEMALAYPNLMPRLHILQPIYREVHALITGKPFRPAG